MLPRAHWSPWLRRDPIGPCQPARPSGRTICGMTTTAAKSSAGPTGTKRRADAAVPHPSVAERVDRGRAARAQAPRRSHAAFVPAPDRVDPVILLERQAETRVPELVPIRY